MPLTQVIENFTLRLTTLVCPACNSMFGTFTLVGMPEITPRTWIETDLHRVLPDADLRGALVAVCPACEYASWVTAFTERVIDPRILPSAPVMQPAKKFAQAVLTGRQNKIHALDISLLALNGCWCAREAAEPHERWLALAGKELERALQDEEWQDNRHYYHYIAGEVCRQMSDFHGAVRHYNKVVPQIRLPKELIDSQKVRAIAGDCDPSLLPPHLVEQLFCPRRRREANSP